MLCKHCGGKDFRLSKRSLWERYAGYMAPFRPYRCYLCDGRFWGLARRPYPKAQGFVWLAIAVALVLVAAYALLKLPIGRFLPGNDSRSQAIVEEERSSSMPSELAGEPGEEAAGIELTDDSVDPLQSTADMEADPDIPEQEDLTQPQSLNASSGDRLPPPTRGVPVDVSSVDEQNPATVAPDMSSVTSNSLQENAIAGFEIQPQGDRLRVLVRANRPIEQYTVTVLDGELARLVLDLKGVWQVGEDVPKRFELEYGVLLRMRWGLHADYLRIVFDMSKKAERPRITVQPEGLAIDWES